MHNGSMESGTHLFQTPQFTVGDGHWCSQFGEAVAAAPKALTWDPAGLLGVLSLGYTTGDRTLIREITRQPWLSEINGSGKPVLSPVPAHGTLWVDEREAAATLLERLRAEAITVCAGRRQVFILLSGGLDSRIVAGVVGQLRSEGLIESECVAVTWGTSDSRDVVYARAVAEALGIKWQHIDLRPDDLVGNIDLMARSLGCLATPDHLHAMGWFKEVASDALVLAGSYGDSVGRAEFSRQHVLELRPLSVTNPLGLMKPNVASVAVDRIRADLAALHARTPGQPRYVLCEHEMQGFYMRNLFGSVMAAISHHVPLYQLFTDPQVYGYMWSLHPSLRTDAIYGELLEMLHPRLPRLPWARTNRAPRGRTEGAVAGLSRRFHCYAEWTREYAYPRLAHLVDEAWFAATGIFDGGRVRTLSERVRDGAASLAYAGCDAYALWLWLASFRVFVEGLEERDKKIELGFVPEIDSPILETDHVSEQRAGLVRRVVRQVPIVRRMVSQVRRTLARRDAVRRYPPTKQLRVSQPTRL